jgi:dipeptidyl aminopeptidase/acylaminoacyl peptidase
MKKKTVFIVIALLIVASIAYPVSVTLSQFYQQQIQPFSIAVVPATATSTLEWFLVTPSPLPPPPTSTPRITPTAPTPITETRAYNPQLPLRAEDITLHTVYSLAVGSDITFKSWSPDGEKFLFGRVNQRYILVQFQNGAAANGFWDDLWVASVDGTYQHQLAELVNDWAWSPDGQQVAYLTPAGEQGIEGHLYVVNLENLQSTQIADCDLGGMDDIFWLPTNEITCRQQGVLYAVVSDGSQSRKVNDIFSATSITDTLTKEILPPVFQGDYHISPNGTKLAYILVDSPSSLHISELNGDNAVEVKVVPYLSYDWIWSPDSNTLVFNVPNGQGRLGTDLWVVNANGSNLRRVTVTEREDAMCIEPTWSPDGRVLAYTYRDNADYQPESVWIVNVDGTNPHLLVDLAFDPQWAVQGNQITVSRLKSFTDNLETFLVQVDLGQH